MSPQYVGPLTPFLQSLPCNYSRLPMFDNVEEAREHTFCLEGETFSCMDCGTRHCPWVEGPGHREG